MKKTIQFLTNLAEDLVVKAFSILIEAFSWTGYQSRKGYWKTLLTVILIMLPFYKTLDPGTAFQIGLVFTWVLLASHAKRLRDAGYSPWLAWFGIIVLTWIGIFVICGFFKSNPKVAAIDGQPIPE